MVVSGSARLRLAALVTLVLATMIGPAFAQGTTPRPAPDRWEAERLRRVIEERYTVVPLRDGVALVPRRESRDVKSIELSGDTVAINGSPVTGAEVRERLKSDGDAVLALSYLGPDARRALFAASGKPAESPAPPAQREVLPETPAPPPGANEPEVRRSQPRSSRSDAKVHIGGGVQVNEDESVDGPVVAIGGSATINGEVRQDVVAIAGNVRLGPKAKVGGDVTAVGGTVDRDATAEVDGRINEVGLRFPSVHLGRGFWGPRGLLAGVWRPHVEIVATLFRMLLFGLLVFLVFILARNPVARIERAAGAEPWKAGLVGVFTQLLFLPVFLLTILILVISIVGIPLLFFVPPLAVLAFVAAFVLGFTGVAFRLGRWLEYRFGWAPQSPYLLLVVGLVAIWAITIAGRIVSLGGWPVWAVSTALLVIGFLVEYVAWTVGLGAAVMTRFGTRPAGGSGPTTPAASAVASGSQAGGTA